MDERHALEIAKKIKEFLVASDARTEKMVFTIAPDGSGNVSIELEVKVFCGGDFRVL